MAASPRNVLWLQYHCARWMRYFSARGRLEIVIKSRARSTVASNSRVSPVEQSCLLIAGGSPLRNWCSNNRSLASCGSSGMAWLNNLLRSCRNKGKASPGSNVLWLNLSRAEKAGGSNLLLIAFFCFAAGSPPCPLLSIRARLPELLLLIALVTWSL